MSGHSRLSTIALLVVVAFSATVFAPMAALASTKGRQNTAVGLTAGAVAAALTHHNTAAVVLGGGAAYAWKRHADARKSDLRTRSYQQSRLRAHHRAQLAAKKKYAAKKYAQRH